MKRTDAGFTLIELVVTLALVSVMLAFLPLSREVVPEIQVNKATRTIAQTIREARATAVKRGNDVVVCFDLANDRVDVYDDADLDGPDIEELMRSVRISEIGGGASFRAVSTTGVDGLSIGAAVNLAATTDPPRVTFRPNGSAINPGTAYLAPTHSGTIELGRAIEVLSTGRVQTWKFAVAGAPGPWEKWL